MLRKSNKIKRPIVAVIGTRGYPSFYGGFETAIRKLAPHLAEKGWHVRVYGRKGTLSSGFHDTDPRIVSILTPGINSRSLGTLTFGLTATLHALIHKPDVALVMNVANGFWLPLLKIRGIPTVVNVDGLEWTRDKWNWLGKTIFLWGAKCTAQFAEQLVFDAVAISIYWNERFARLGVFIPYGGDAAKSGGCKSEFTPERYVLLVARFVPENSVKEFFEAAPTIISTCDVDVVIVGAAPSGDPLQSQAEELSRINPRVHLLGHISDDQRLFNLWRHAGVYFHGHTVGGTNPALVQAMALGARILASDTVYNREVLGESGRFCASDTHAVIRGVASTLQDPRDLGAMARDRASIEYTWDLVCSRYDAILRAQLN